jgi:hypothetical protein
MRGNRTALAALLGALVWLAGCQSTNSHLKPPEHPDELTTPPTADARYTQPPEFPKGTLNNDELAKKDKDPSVPGSSLRNTSGRSGMGGGPGGGMSGP